MIFFFWVSGVAGQGTVGFFYFGAMLGLYCCGSVCDSSCGTGSRGCGLSTEVCGLSSCHMWDLVP